jgi:hypothetical protein
MKVTRLRIQIDMEIDASLEHFREDEDFEGTVRFFFEENHCVENETERALQLFKAARERAAAKMRVENPTIPESASVCITCNGAKVTLLGIREEP